VASLKPLPGNPRRGDVDAVAASLARFGQRKPIVVRASDRTITAGNHTWLAAQQLGWDEIAAVLVDDDDTTAQAFALADNRTAELGGYDDGLLLELIRAVGEADASARADTGWSDEAIAELIDRIDPGLPDSPPSDDAPEPPEIPFSEAGQIWLLGSHRVVCGDATSVADLEALMAGGQADCVWTDPPYGIAVVGGSRGLSPTERLKRGGKTIQNDTLDEGQLTEFLGSTLGNALRVCRPGSAWYVTAPHGPIGLAFSAALSDLGVWRHSLVWVKDSLVMGRSDYHYRHEPIYYGWTPGGGHDWFGDRKQTTVLEFPRPKRNAEHPTMKPIDLIAYCLENSAPKGGTVLDPFGGSGSTLMACEYTGRKARLLELDPRYVDVICRRWQEHTGSTPILEATGEPHDFAKAADA
jgi:site-specific DNA-methyltransferase (adenine-specific)